MKKVFFALVVLFTLCGSMPVKADEGSNRIMLGVGALYERGLDVTLSYEHETTYHNTWEYFANAYLKYEECESCGHICPESFWHSYNSWDLGIAYKPCVVRNRNNDGNLRIGGFVGSDTNEVIGGGTVGYEHNYTLKGGFQLYWQVKSDIVINGKDLFRTGIVLGFKLPL